MQPVTSLNVNEIYCFQNSIPWQAFFFFFKENNKKSLLRGIEKSASKAQKTPMAPTKGSVSFVLCFAVSYRSCVFGLGVLL